MSSDDNNDKVGLEGSLEQENSLMHTNDNNDSSIHKPMHHEGNTNAENNKRDNDEEEEIDSNNESSMTDNFSEVSEIDPESAVLAPVQRRIEEQLRRHLQELTQQLREANNDFSIVVHEREETGVDLYNAQQHLAKLQETLELHHERHNLAQQEYEAKLQERELLSHTVEEIERKVQQADKEYNRQQSELDRVSASLLTAQQYNEELKSQVEVERQAAHKTEDDITRLERAKAQQDALVLSLQTRIRHLEEETAKVEEQTKEQREETRRARDTLAEAMSEMEALNVEKRHLVQQWKSSLLGMQRRHDAMKKTDEALQQQKDELQLMENEIARYRQDIRSVQGESAKLNEFLSRVDNETMLLQHQMDALLERKNKDTESFALVQDAITNAVNDTKLLESELKVKNKELDEVQRHINKYNKSIVDLENEVLTHLSKQTTLKQESKGVLEDIEKIKTSIYAKEQQVTQMENEMARVRVDILQATTYNETLQSSLSELEKELQSRMKTIENMQVDIRRRNEEVDRKQKQLDQLNHQYAQIISTNDSGDNEHIGPLEATIHSLTKSITAKASENDALQQQWIRLQTELVASNNTLNDLNEAILDAQSKSAILGQRRDRLLTQINSKKQEIGALQNKTNALHLEMKRVNTLLNERAENKDTVLNEAVLLENDLIRRLEDKRRDAIQLEHKVREVQQQKQDLVQQIMDCERDIMFWERKLQIARETKMALDPTIGKAEIEKMKKEITIMEQRVNQLQREQKFLTEEMQKLIDHREIIRAKGKAVLSAAERNKRGVSRLTVEKENARLFKELQTKRHEAQAKEQAIKEHLAEVERTAMAIDRTQQELIEIEAQLQECAAQSQAAKEEQIRVDAERQLRHGTLQRLRDGQSGTYTLSCYPEEVAVEQERLEEGKRGVVEVMSNLASEFPQLADELHDLMSNV